MARPLAACPRQPRLFSAPRRPPAPSPTRRFFSLSAALLAAVSLAVLLEPSAHVALAETETDVSSAPRADSQPKDESSPSEETPVESRALTAVDDDSEGAVKSAPNLLGLFDRFKDFPGVGDQGRGILQMAEEGLGINLSKLELKQIVPMLADLQKNVHTHYLLTKASGKQHAPSSLLKRVVGRKTQSRVIKSMKKFAPNTEDGELIQQLDVVTQLLHELHSNPTNDMTDILKRVVSGAGFDLQEEDVEHIQTHMKWANDLIVKFMPHFPEFFGSHRSDEL